ncbi:MAG: PfkB family carbohydrate kinase [Rhodobacteraceae bacterium]|nr:PfkB family carbohydrate kinase [Paracoccaceae bacterium]
MTKIFAFGLAVIDFVYRVETLPNTGDKYFTTDAYIIGGGCAANAAVAISKLGGEVSFGGRVGSDVIGDLIIQDLENYGFSEPSMISRAPNSRSSYSSVAIDPNGERQIINFRGESLIEETDWIWDAPDVDAYLTDVIWPKGAQTTMEVAKKRDKPGIIDVEPMQDYTCLKDASHVAFSYQGLYSLTQSRDPVEGLKMIKDKLPGWLCVTNGEKGVYFLDGNKVENIPGHTIQPQETLGAGDVWHGAFALKLAEGGSEIQAMEFANATAALKCQTTKGRENYPTRQEVETFIGKM